MGHEGHDHEHDHAPDRAHDPAHAPPLVPEPSAGASSIASAHPHASAPAHAQPHDRPPHPPPLSPSSGAGKLLFLDAPSGLAGDMIIAALLDLGVPAGVVTGALQSLSLSGYQVHVGARTRSGIVATAFDVHVDGAQPQRTYAAIRAMLDAAPLEPPVKERAQRTFLRLATAEAKVHRSSIDDVHFHEVGAVDAIVDVVGSAAALAYLGADLVVSPLPMGRGFVRAAHGVLPLPAPATVDCLAGLATYDAGADFEFVTPTGAAIVGAHASGSHRWPSMSPERTGWGAGTAELADRPNVLRAVLGVPAAAAHPAAAATHTVLEANVDDATGELAGSWIDALLAAGALDAWAAPITMKKGRPALTIAALAPLEHAGAVAHAMLRETTSLGVRRHDVTRLERPRTIDVVETPFGRIPVKVAGGPFGPPQVKPEFDACARAAREYGVPVREVLRVAVACWQGAAERGQHGSGTG